MRAPQSCDGSTQEFNVALRIKRNPQTSLAHHHLVLIIIITALMNTCSVQLCAQTAANPGWPLLEVGLQQKSVGQRLGAVRVLGLIPDDPHAAELAEKALIDPGSLVQVAGCVIPRPDARIGSGHKPKASGQRQKPLGCDRSRTCFVLAE